MEPVAVNEEFKWYRVAAKVIFVFVLGPWWLWGWGWGWGLG